VEGEEEVDHALQVLDALAALEQWLKRRVRLVRVGVGLRHL
tara:strand:- start:21 stop:143 length:123 start_codon:yes stop_codon:yes gene_type:complete